MLTNSLPTVERIPVFSLFYTARIALVVLLLFVFLGSGMVLAAYNSTANSPLFPIKKALIQTQLQFVKDPVVRQQLQKEIAAPMPTQLAPTPTEKPEPTNEMERHMQVPADGMHHAALHPTAIEKGNYGEESAIQNKVLGASTKNGSEKKGSSALVTPNPTISFLQRHENND